MKKIDGMRHFQGFIKFIQERGVIGLAVGFILGGSVTKLVSSLVDDMISPVLSLAIGRLENMEEAVWEIGAAKIMWGSFVSNLIDFVVIAAVVYFGIKLMSKFGLGEEKK